MLRKHLSLHKMRGYRSDCTSGCAALAWVGCASLALCLGLKVISARRNKNAAIPATVRNVISNGMACSFMRLAHRSKASRLR